MQKILTASGALLTVVGLILIPLPGPGFLLLVPGLVLLVAAAGLLLLRRGTAHRSNSSKKSP